MPGSRRHGHFAALKFIDLFVENVLWNFDLVLNNFGQHFFNIDDFDNVLDVVTLNFGMVK